MPRNVTRCRRCTYSVGDDDDICDDCIDGDEFQLRKLPEFKKGRFNSKYTSHFEDCESCRYAIWISNEPQPVCDVCEDAEEYEKRSSSDPSGRPLKPRTKPKPQKENPMTTSTMTTSTIVKTLIEDNKLALAETAKIKTADILLSNATKIIESYIPTEFEHYLSLPGAEFVIANIASIFLQVFGKGEVKAQTASNALLLAAQLKLVEKFDPLQIYQELTAGMEEAPKEEGE